MPCRCGSFNTSKFIGEMGIHTPGLQGINKPVVWVFPELIVCSDCGRAEFAVPENELVQLGLLAKSDGAAAG